MHPSDQENDSKQTTRFLAELAPSNFEQTVLNDDWLNVQPKSRIIKALKVLGARLQDASTAKINKEEVLESINMSIPTADVDYINVEITVPDGLIAKSDGSDVLWEVELIPKEQEYPSLKLKILGNFTIGRNRPGKPVDLDLMPYQGSSFGVSGQHASMRVNTDGLFLHDLNSTNGTYYRKQKLDVGIPVKLEEGTIVAFGKLTFLIADIKHLN